MACHPCASEFRSILKSPANASCAFRAPSEWLSESDKHILATLDQIDLKDEELYLLVYTFVHAKFCLPDPLQLDALKKELSKWSKYSDLNKLLQCAIVKTTLCRFLGLHQEPYSDQSCNVREHVQLILDLDMARTAVQVQSMLCERGRQKILLNLAGEEAQMALNLMQMLHDFTGLDHRLRPRIVGALYTLTRKSGLYPECLILRNVNHEGTNPVYGGAFGDIRRGDIGGYPIAIKVMRVWTTSDIRKLLKVFSMEAVLWRQLSHPNVLPFYGIYHWDDEPSHVCLVSPWMENGNLLQYLEAHPDANRVPLLRDVACGLCYLHNCRPSIIHGDLKGANILITPLGRACLTDFGLSRLVSESKVLLTSSGAMANKGGTLPWKAPELIDLESEAPKATSAASDIYAYGGVCYETFVGLPPFHDFKNEWLIMGAVLKGHRPTRPSEGQHASVGLDDALWTMIEHCWHRDPLSRPSANEIADILLTRTATAELDTSGWDSSILVQLRPTLPDELFAHSDTARGPFPDSTVDTPTSDNDKASTSHPRDRTGPHVPFWRQSDTAPWQDPGPLDIQAGSQIDSNQSQEYGMLTGAESPTACGSSSPEATGHPEGNEDFFSIIEWSEYGDLYSPRIDADTSSEADNELLKRDSDPTVQFFSDDAQLKDGTESPALLPNLSTEYIPNSGLDLRTPSTTILQDAGQDQRLAQRPQPESPDALPNSGHGEVTIKGSFTIAQILCPEHPSLPGSPIYWDLRTSPNLASLCSSGAAPRALGADELEHLAVFPPMQKLTIMCSKFPHDWSIPVEDPEGITVSRVLLTTYQTVRKHISISEWVALTPDLRMRVRDAFHLRCSSSMDPPSERSQGICRIDCLSEHTKFDGLVWKSIEDGVCEMRLRDISASQAGTDARRRCYAIAVPTFW